VQSDALSQAGHPQRHGCWIRRHACCCSRPQLYARRRHWRNRDDRRTEGPSLAHLPLRRQRN